MHNSGRDASDQMLVVSVCGRFRKPRCSIPGGPAIIVPYIQRAPLKLDHIMVCWDSSRAAARAIRDAMPFLRRAGRIEVVTVTNERSKQHQIERADIGAHLARHGPRRRESSRSRIWSSGERAERRSPTWSESPLLPCKSLAQDWVSVCGDLFLTLEPDCCGELHPALMEPPIIVLMMPAKA